MSYSISQAAEYLGLPTWVIEKLSNGDLNILRPNINSGNGHKKYEEENLDRLKYNKKQLNLMKYYSFINKFVHISSVSKQYLIDEIRKQKDISILVPDVETLKENIGLDLIIKINTKFNKTENEYIEVINLIANTKIGQRNMCIIDMLAQKNGYPFDDEHRLFFKPEDNGSCEHYPYYKSGDFDKIKKIAIDMISYFGILEDKFNFNFNYMSNKLSSEYLILDKVSICLNSADNDNGTYCEILLCTPMQHEQLLNIK